MAKRVRFAYVTSSIHPTYPSLVPLPQYALLAANTSAARNAAPLQKATNDNGRTVYLPLIEMKRCFACRKQSRVVDVELKACKACGEATYCSKGCQTTDWKAHKTQCGKTDRIELHSFYPFLAYIAELSRYIPAIERHPALRCFIIHDPQCVKLPDGTSSRLVLLGHKMPETTPIPSEAWWPAAPSPAARARLAQRIVNERLLLPTLLSICIALVSEIYTTTALPSIAVSEPPIILADEKRRVRLSHQQSPITDFGIDLGSVNVSKEDTLAYYLTEEDKLIRGRDPQEHYWIYFKTLSGHDYYLDLGMFTFNADILVDATPYCQKDHLVKLDHVPALLLKRDSMDPQLTGMDFKIQRRTSILRDSTVHTLIRSMDIDPVYFNKECESMIFKIMDTVAGRECGEYERKIAVEMLPIEIEFVRGNVRDRDYISFPKDPPKVVRAEQDRDLDFTDDAESQRELVKFLENRAKQLKKEKISRE